jgi:hypothetical protein
MSNVIVLTHPLPEKSLTSTKLTRVNEQNLHAISAGFHFRRLDIHPLGKWGAKQTRPSLCLLAQFL